MSFSIPPIEDREIAWASELMGPRAEWLRCD